MTITNTRQIGNKLLHFRKKLGMTQTEVAEAAGLSNRTYADIERGTVNMRVDTILKICNALYITPDQVLTEEKSSTDLQQEELFSRLNACSQKDRITALKLLSVYLDSLS